MKQPELSDFRDVLERARRSAEEAGLTPDDVEEALRQVGPETVRATRTASCVQTASSSA